LLHVVKRKETELLFLALVIRLLKPGGQAAVIVPDGVQFGSSTAHKTLRRMIVEDQKLDGIISMPGGVFKPCASVSTAILLFTKTNSGGTGHVWFYDMQADGKSLDDLSINRYKEVVHVEVDHRAHVLHFGIYVQISSLKRLNWFLSNTSALLEEKMTIRAPMCYYCVHFVDHTEIGKMATCAAFPNGIPVTILDHGFDHRKPYNGDNGIQFESRKTVASSPLHAGWTPP
jgi:N-6 DNA Methylase